MAKKSGFSLLEKFSIIFLLFAAIYLIYSFYMPVLDVISGKTFEPMDFILDLTILLIGTCALWGGINLAKRTIVLEQLIDMGFEKEIYRRLDPILGEIAGTQVMVNKIEERLNNMNINIEILRNRSVELRIPGSSAFGIDISAEVSRFLRLVILINISIAAFIFLLNFTRSYTPFFITILYIIWWLEITYEYNLWQRSSVWYWVFVPILTIPITTILGDIIYGGEILLGSMGIGLAVYAGAYYTWSKYLIEGTLPFDLNELKSKIPVDNRSFSYLMSFKSTFSQKRHTIAASLIAGSVIFASLLILQLISVNIYALEWLPKFSLDQIGIMGILSVILYLSGTRLRHKKESKKVEAA
ncbi:MAG TPA: hypothetical protein VMW20_06450 [Candidatus Nanoarchaeia archaeon]|nr:hypothetical protein [Candidatus Nanoarchaeia archaeon]